MTTSELSLEQQLELAKKIDQGKNWEIFLGSICEMDANGNSYGFPFNPSLTGEDWQQAQALRVIVAAPKAFRNFSIMVFMPESIYAVVATTNEGKTIEIANQPNLLHASALALLGDKT